MSDDLVAQRPPMNGFHHFAATVTDVEASVAWYQRILGLQRVPAKFPHHGNEESGFAILLTDPQSNITVGLHHHNTNDGQPCDERRTGLDHIGIFVPNRSDLNSWASWLDAQNISHSGVTTADGPFRYSVLVFRDPDNIQLEMFYVDS